MTDFLNRLAQTLESSDWSVQHKNDGLIAKKTAVLSKWLLGSRKILHRMVIKFNPDKQELVLNETAAEISIGIPPPSFIASQWQQKNLDYREDRTDSGWGGGNLHYGEGCQTIRDFCTHEGWTLRSERS